LPKMSLRVARRLVKRKYWERGRPARIWSEESLWLPIKVLRQRDYAGGTPALPVRQHL